MAEGKSIHFDISYATFFKLAVIIIVAAFLFLVREVLLMMFLAIVIAASLDPAVDFLQKRKLPRGVAVVIIYSSFIAVVAVTLALIIPALTTEIEQLGNILPGYLQDLARSIEGASGTSIGESVQQLSGYIDDIAEEFDEAFVSIYQAIYRVFGGLFSVMLVFVLSFYFLIQENAFKKFIQSFIPKKHRKHAQSLVDKIQEQMGNWLRGQLILGLVVGVVTYIVLSLLGVKYALVLAIFAGVLEIVPYIGPVIAAVPAVFLALLQSPVTGLLVLIAYVVIQQFENHLLVPKIMQKAVGLNPLVVILVILAGAKIAGVAGAIIAVPAATAISVISSDYFNDNWNTKKGEKE